MNTVELQDYITQGAEAIVAEAVHATLRDPIEAAFMARFAIASAKAADRRNKSEKDGLHVPTFLIASITSACNLHCAGCYSRAEHATQDCEPVRQLTAEDWDRVFAEAEEMGISFILLAGGEPLLRRSVLEKAAARPNLLFPVFTNGTYLDGKYFDLFDRKRNMIPVVSIEGGREKTDTRRGEGVYDLLRANMEEFSRRGILWGASVTVTRENLDEAVSPVFAEELTSKGCRLFIFVEYVPVTEDSRDLAPDEEDREKIRKTVGELRSKFPGALFLTFPGDEKASDGCLAAGRGFFHINSHGGAEPCPFSPYSDVNVKETSLRAALKSGLFEKIRDGGLLLEEHVGGCTLFERRGEVEAIAKASES